MSGEATRGSARGRHYAVDLKRYYRIPAVQVSLTAVLSLVVAAFFIVVAIRPTLVTVATLKKNIEASQKTLKQLETKEKAVQQAAALWEQLQADSNQVDQAVPVTGARYDDFSKSLERVAARAGVVLSSVTLGESIIYSEIIKPYEGRGRSVVLLPLTIRVNGTYQGVRTFFTMLTETPRLVNIETLSIGRENAGGESSVALSLTGSIGYLADQKVLEQIFPKKNGK